MNSASGLRDKTVIYLRKWKSQNPIRSYREEYKQIEYLLKMLEQRALEERTIRFIARQVKQQFPLKPKIK